MNPGGQRQLGNYRLQRHLASGGFADVYLGEHIYLGTQAAIKVLRSQMSSNEHEEFLAEARRAAALRHPHIISVLDFGIQNNVPYLVMDYASNGTLRRRYPRSTRVPLPDIVRYVEQVASALQYAHQRKIVHRDVKPENMMIGASGDILLGDFGIAVAVHRPETMTLQQVLGTYSYIAPEQASGRARPESDQYSLAAVVYEWICGSPPFTSDNPVMLIQQHMQNPPPSLTARMPGLARAIEEAVFKALAKDPGQRFPTVEAFSQAFRDAVYTSLRASTEFRPDERPRAQSQSRVAPDAFTERESAVPVTPSVPSNSFNKRDEHATTPLGGNFSTPPERVQLALVIEKRASWETQQRENAVKAGKADMLTDVDVCYQQGLRARALNNNEEAALWWLQGLARDPDYNNGILAQLVRDAFRRLVPAHLELLRSRLEAVRQALDLDKEIKLLEDMQVLDPHNQHISQQLVQARLDKQYLWMYRKAQEFLRDGDVLLAVEQLRILEEVAPTFRNLPELREQIINYLCQQVDDATKHGNYADAARLLLQTRTFFPSNERIQRFQEQWCASVYEMAQQSLLSTDPIPALAQIGAIQIAVSNYRDLGTMRKQVYQRMCWLANTAIQAKDFSLAQQRLEAIEQHFTPAERKSYAPAPVPATLSAGGSGNSAGGAQPAPVAEPSFEDLQERLRLTQAQHIAEQQLAVFQEGEKARRRGDYQDARRIWEELQQQNPDFSANNVRGVQMPLKEHLASMLGEQADKAARAGNWQQAQALWSDVVASAPTDVEQARRKLRLAEQNAQYQPRYEQAEQELKQQHLAQAQVLLQEVWSNAPGYGDPSRLAKPAGLYSPLSPDKSIWMVVATALAGIVSGVLLHSVALAVLLAVLIAAAAYGYAENLRQGSPKLRIVLAGVGIVLVLLGALLFIHY